jgi:hypothetical protein
MPRRAGTKPARQDTTLRAAAADAMKLDNPSLVFDLVEWVAQRPRPYHEVMEAWRTSCPRLTIWEDAIDHGLVEQAPDANGHTIVVITARGRDFLVERI